MNKDRYTNSVFQTEATPTWAFAALWYDSIENGGSDFIQGDGELPADAAKAQPLTQEAVNYYNRQGRMVDETFLKYYTYRRTYVGKRFSSESEANEWLNRQKLISRASWANFLRD